MTWRLLRKYAMLATLGALTSSCVSPEPVLPEPQDCQSPLIPLPTPTPKNECPDDPDLVCYPLSYAVDLGLYIRSVERSRQRLESCPWVHWLPL